MAAINTSFFEMPILDAGFPPIDFISQRDVSELTRAELESELLHLRDRYETLFNYALSINAERDDLNSELRFETSFNSSLPSVTSSTSETETSTRETPETGPVLLNPNEIPNDVICSVCWNVPIQPVVTPCQHMFCRDCIERSLQFQSRCPMDRSPCTMQDVQVPRQGIHALYDTWRSVQVKCEHHSNGCTWTGSILRYNRHLSMCSGSSQSHQEKIKKLEKKIAVQRHEKIELCRKLSKYKKRSNCLKVAASERKKFEYLCKQKDIQLKGLEAKVRDLKKKTRELGLSLEEKEHSLSKYKKKCERRTQDDMLLFEGNLCCFDSRNLIELSQFIARNLNRKPSKVDPVRVFYCIKTCYIDFLRYRDESCTYRKNVRMLLATSYACTWLYTDQRKDIKKWLTDQQWC